MFTNKESEICFEMLPLSESQKVAFYKHVYKEQHEKDNKDFDKLTEKLAIPEKEEDPYSNLKMVPEVPDSVNDSKIEITEEVL